VVGIILIFVGMALTFRKGREGELSVERNATSEI
ncbi:permease, partial [Bacillus thuringiensis]|nr:permease [Bacillus thuringiensis]